MLAPIALDAHSGTQRRHASETVHAYCLDHALQLSALIFLPQASPAPQNADSGRQRPHYPIKSSGTPDKASTHGLWEKEVEHLSMQPIAIVADYFDLLVKASGRVIMISRCLRNGESEDGYSRMLATLLRRLSDRCGLEGLSDGVRECLAMNLNSRLRSSGVRICSLSTGDPDDFEGHREYRGVHGINSGATVARMDLQRNAASAAGGSHQADHTLTPYTAAVCDMLQDIAGSRHVEAPLEHRTNRN